MCKKLAAVGSSATAGTKLTLIPVTQLCHEGGGGPSPQEGPRALDRVTEMVGNRDSGTTEQGITPTAVGRRTPPGRDRRGAHLQRVQQREQLERRSEQRKKAHRSPDGMARTFHKRRSAPETPRERQALTRVKKCPRVQKNEGTETRESKKEAKR